MRQNVACRLENRIKQKSVALCNYCWRTLTLFKSAVRDFSSNFVALIFPTESSVAIISCLLHPLKFAKSFSRLKIWPLKYFCFVPRLLNSSPKFWVKTKVAQSWKKNFVNFLATSLKTQTWLLQWTSHCIVTENGCYEIKTQFSHGLFTHFSPLA